MNATRLVAIALIVFGLLGLLYGGFTYITITSRSKVGSVEVSTGNRHTVYIPFGAVLLFVY